ncbi:MAG: glycosyltransferase family 4 protein [Thermodesulfobacteriota bacterium]
MAGTALNNRGGVASVLRVYDTDGFFGQWQVHYLASHVPGPAAAKTRAALVTWLTFLRLLGRRQVGLVHVHSASRASFWRKAPILLAALAARRPIVFHLHGSEFALFFDQSPPPAKALIRLVLDRASRIVVLSSAWPAALRRLTGNRRISVVFNPVPRAILDVAPAAGHRCPRRILYLGRLEEKKGVFDLVRACGQLAAGRPDLELVLAGEGDQEPLRQLAANVGLAGQLAMPGWIEGDAKAQALATAGLFVLPSYTECMPMGLLEAMAAGLPVVATPVGGVPDAVQHGVEGFLSPVGQPEALAASLAPLLDDPDLGRAMGAAGQERIRRQFVSDRIFEQLGEIYQDLGVQQPPRRLP